MFFRLLALMVILPAVSAVLPAAFGATAEYGAVRQITFGAYHHVLTNANVWSPDGNRIVYDLRSPGRFDGERIEDVDVLSGNRRILYQSRNGAHCGVATYCHTRERIVFILGPENPTPDWSYGFSRRRGVVVATDAPSEIRPLDAMNYRPPFAPGALRGGSHLHVFSPDGKWVSFTYDDELLARLDASSTTAGHEPNQRNIGIAVPWGPVQVAKNFPRNHDGDWFSVLVTRTAANPKPGSEEISRASEEAWVGTAGYIRPDGTRQQRALAFQGEVAAPDGSKHSEVFIVDLPDDLTVVGEEPLAGTPTTRPAPQQRALAFQGDVAAPDGSKHSEVFIVDLPDDLTVVGEEPLAGTPTTRPAPPKGVFQRRLTYTSESRYPGLAAVPRHWLRSAPDGSAIAFLQKDTAGVAQLWTISPNGGASRQVTDNDHDITSSFTWSPDGRFIAHVMDETICLTEVATGTTRRITAPRMNAVPLPFACVFSPDGQKICFGSTGGVRADGFSQIFTVDVPR